MATLDSELEELRALYGPVVANWTAEDWDNDVFGGMEEDGELPWIPIDDPDVTPEVGLAEVADGASVELAFGIGGLVRGAFGKGPRSAGHGGHLPDGRLVKRNAKGEYAGSEKGAGHEKGLLGRRKGTEGETHTVGRKRAAGGAEKDTPNSRASRRMAKPKAARVTKATRAVAAKRQELAGKVAAPERGQRAHGLEAQAKVERAQKSFDEANRAYNEIRGHYLQTRASEAATKERLQQEVHNASDAHGAAHESAREELMNARAHAAGQAAPEGSPKALRYQKMLAAHQPMLHARAAEEQAKAHDKSAQAHFDKVWATAREANPNKDLTTLIRTNADVKAAWREHTAASTARTKAQNARYRAERAYESPRDSLAGLTGAKGEALRNQIRAEAAQHPSVVAAAARLDAAHAARNAFKETTGKDSKALQKVYTSLATKLSREQALRDAQLEAQHPEWARATHTDARVVAKRTSIDHWKPEDLAKVRAAADPNNPYNQHGDAALAEILKMQGFDRKPDVVSEAELRAYIKKGEIQLWRGESQAKHADAMMFGEYHAGTGIHGNGTYAATDRSEAGGYGRWYKNAKGNIQKEGRLLHMTIKQGSREFGDKAEAQHMADRARVAQMIKDKSGDAAHLDNLKWLVNGDFGRYAAAMGYDHVGSDGVVVIWNRTALRISNQPRSGNAEESFGGLE